MWTANPSRLGKSKEICNFILSELGQYSYICKTSECHLHSSKLNMQKYPNLEHNSNYLTTMHVSQRCGHWSPQGQIISLGGALGTVLLGGPQTHSGLVAAPQHNLI